MENKYFNGNKKRVEWVWEDVVGHSNEMFTKGHFVLQYCQWIFERWGQVGDYLN